MLGRVEISETTSEPLCGKDKAVAVFHLVRSSEELILLLDGYSLGLWL